MWHVDMALWHGSIFCFFGRALFRIYKAENNKKLKAKKLPAESAENK